MPALGSEDQLCFELGVGPQPLPPTSPSLSFQSWKTSLVEAPEFVLRHLIRLCDPRGEGA